MSRASGSGASASVKLSSGTEAAITSPKGGRPQRFDAAGAFLGHVSCPEVCGVAPLGQGFLLSDGLGGLVAL